jgi:quercetin dioxygenase-like cupin family protein
MGEDHEPRGVLSPTELVAYQPGSVVSRTLLKNGAGSITLFAFDEGQELSEHTVPHDAVIQLLDGEAEIRIAGTPYRVGRGEMIVLPGSRPHAVRALGRFKMLLTMLRSR